MIHDLYKPELELVEKIINNSSDDLLTLFDKRTKRWRYPMMHCEGFTIGTFDDLTEGVSPERAFFLITIALNIVLDQKENDLFITALSLLNGLC